MDETLVGSDGHFGPGSPAGPPDLARDARPPQERQFDAGAQDRAGDRPALQGGRTASARGNRRPLTGTALPAVVRRWFEIEGLAAAPAPARNARTCPSRAKRAAGRRDRRGQDAGGFPPDHLRTGRQPERGPAHALRLAIEGARGRRSAEPNWPVEEMGLPIRVETRTGDTPSDRKARQRVKPPAVRPAISRSIARSTIASVPGSRLEVASSSTSTAGSASAARASDTSCFSPADSREPRSRTSVSSPSGRTANRSYAPDDAAARRRPRRRWRRPGRCGRCRGSCR